MNDLEWQRYLRLERDTLANDAPNCPTCLHQMEPAEVNGHPVWRCVACDEVRSAD